MKAFTLTDGLFRDLVTAAALAPSADNMQPWEFRRNGNHIEARCAAARLLPTDVGHMFSWVSLGAAIQNIVVEASSRKLTADVTFANRPYDKADLQDVIPPKGGTSPIIVPTTVIKLHPGSNVNDLSQWIDRRATNRNPYEAYPLNPVLISRMTAAVEGLKAGIHWTAAAADLDRMARMDAHSSYIRLEHKPLHDELFSILRFTRKELEATRYGLDFASLQVPSFAVVMARQLQYWSVNRAVSKLGLGRLVAKALSEKLRKAGALCLVTAKERSPEGYLEAGRAMEQLWLAATAEGLSVHPYGVLPQYLTKAELEPTSFLPRHLAVIRSHQAPFNAIFPQAVNEFPAIVLRLGWAERASARSNLRLGVDEIT